MQYKFAEDGVSNLNSGSIGFGGTSWDLETLNLFWLLDSHPWLFSDQPMQRGTYWSRKNLFNDNIGTFCFGRYANTWNAFVYMNSVKWFCGPGEVWELENCNHQPKCLFGRDPLAGVFNFIFKFKSNFFQRAFCNKTKKTPALKCLFLDFYIRRYSLTHKHSYTEVRQDGSICNIWTTSILRCIKTLITLIFKFHRSCL